MKKPSIGRIAVGCAVGLIFALLTPIMLPFSMFLLLAPTALLLVYVYFGAISLAFAEAISIASGVIFYGALGAAAVTLAFVVPAAALAILLARRASYITRLKVSIGAQLIGVGAFLAIVSLTTGQNIADAATGLLGAQIRAMPNGFIDYYLAMLGAAELPTGSINALNGFLADAERQAAIEKVIQTQNLVMRVQLPAWLLGSCVYGGLIACHLPSHILARRGDEAPHLPIAQWRIGRDITIVGILLFVTGQCFYWFVAADYAAPVYLVLNTVSSAVFMAQGLGAVERRGLKGGATRGRRRLLLAGFVALKLMGLNAIDLIGVASALFGSKGVITEIRKNKEDTER